MLAWEARESRCKDGAAAWVLYNEIRPEHERNALCKHVVDIITVTTT